MTLTFPIRIEAGKATTVGYEQTIRQNILALLGTQKGSVFFDRARGSEIKNLMFEPILDVQIDLLYYYIKEALRAETRIKVRNVDVLPNEKNAVVLCYITYTILQLDTVDKIIYEFQSNQ